MPKAHGHNAPASMKCMTARIFLTRSTSDPLSHFAQNRTTDLVGLISLGAARRKRMQARRSNRQVPSLEILASNGCRGRFPLRWIRLHLSYASIEHSSNAASKDAAVQCIPAASGLNLQSVFFVRVILRRMRAFDWRREARRPEYQRPEFESSGLGWEIPTKSRHNSNNALHRYNSSPAGGGGHLRRDPDARGGHIPMI